MYHTVPIYLSEPTPNAFAKVNTATRRHYNSTGQSKVVDQIHQYLLSRTFGKSVPILISFAELAVETEKGIAWIKHVLKRSLDLGLFVIQGWTHGARYIRITPLVIEAAPDSQVLSRGRSKSLNGRSKSLNGRSNENSQTLCMTKGSEFSLKEKRIKEQEQPVADCSGVNFLESLEVGLTETCVSESASVVLEPFDCAQHPQKEPSQEKQQIPREPVMSNSEFDQALSAVEEAIAQKPSPWLRKAILNATLAVILDAIAVLKERQVKQKVENPSAFLCAAIGKQWKPNTIRQASSHPAGTLYTAETLPDWCKAPPDPEKQRSFARRALEVLRKVRLHPKPDPEKLLDDELVVPCAGELPIPRSELQNRIDQAIQRSWEALASRYGPGDRGLLPLPGET